ncbi:glycosyltransferase family 2 protein [bacterium]|nr:glycosyltransferase family 2 protein [bacterium]
MPFISIILPLYNGEEFIEKTLLSIGQQSYYDAELIVVDDGSSDNSCDIINHVISTSSYPVLKNLKIINKENGGVASARNAGIKEAQGKWIAFIDQDDIWFPKKLERQIDVLRESNAKWSYSSFVRFYSNGKEVLKQNGSKNRMETLRLLVSGKLFIPPSTVLVEKSICVTEGGFDSNFIPSDEWDFFLTLAEKYKPAYCHEILVKFRSHPSSTAKKQKRKIFEAQLRVIEKHFSIALENGIEREIKKRVANVLWHLGKEYELEGNKKNARKFYVKAIKNNPSRIKLISSFLSSFF